MCPPGAESSVPSILRLFKCTDFDLGDRVAFCSSECVRIEKITFGAQVCVNATHVSCVCACSLIV